MGLAAVDRSVFILAENRVNLQQVFAELERLYAAPQAQAHLEFLPERVVARGAADTFRQAGVITLSNRQAPAGAEFRGIQRRTRLCMILPTPMVPVSAPEIDDAGEWDLPVHGAA